MSVTLKKKKEEETPSRLCLFSWPVMDQCAASRYRWLIDLQARQGDKCGINASFIEDTLIQKDILLLMGAA